MSTDRGRVGWVIENDPVAAVGRCELEGAVRPVLVVVAAVHAQHSFEMSASEDEDPIEAVAADGAYPALGEGVRVLRFAPAS